MCNSFVCLTRTSLAGIQSHPHARTHTHIYSCLRICKHNAPRLSKVRLALSCSQFISGSRAKRNVATDGSVRSLGRSLMLCVSRCFVSSVSVLFFVFLAWQMQMQQQQQIQCNDKKCIYIKIYFYRNLKKEFRSQISTNCTCVCVWWVCVWLRVHDCIGRVRVCVCVCVGVILGP